MVKRCVVKAVVVLYWQVYVRLCVVVGLCGVCRTLRCELVQWWLHVRLCVLGLHGVVALWFELVKLFWPSSYRF